MGAAYALLPMMTSFMEADSAFRVEYTREMVVAQLLLTAFLMVCQLPTFSSKMLKKNKTDTHFRNRNYLTATAKGITTILVATCLVMFPVKLFFFGTVCHACSLPVGWFVYTHYATQ